MISGGSRNHASFPLFPVQIVYEIDAPSCFKRPGRQMILMLDIHPCIQQLIDLGKEYDLKIMLHSDGNIRNLIPEFIDMGIDILNPIQQVGPDMDPRGLKMEFGKDLCFHGGIDTQGVLPNISVEEVKTEIKEKVEILSQGGGYIVSPTHMLQMDVPLENVITMYEVLNR